MDLPLFLESEAFVPSGLPELRQVIELLLRNSLGEFLQDASLGSMVSVHESTPRIDYAVRTALSSVKGLKVDRVQLEGENVKVQYTLQSHTESFTFIPKTNEV